MHVALLNSKMQKSAATDKQYTYFPVIGRPYIVKVTFRHYRRMIIRPGYSGLKMTVLMHSDAGGY